MEENGRASFGIALISTRGTLSGIVAIRRGLFAWKVTVVALVFLLGWIALVPEKDGFGWSSNAVGLGKCSGNFTGDEVLD